MNKEEEKELLGSRNVKEFETIAYKYKLYASYNIMTKEVEKHYKSLSNPNNAVYVNDVHTDIRKKEKPN